MDSSPPQQMPSQASSRSWSIYGRGEIIQRYEILGRIGSGAYADVYRGRRRSDGLVVALKEIHDYRSSFREIEALQALRGTPNVVDLIEYFWQDDEEDAVLVLEFLPADLCAVIREAKRGGAGIAVGEVKQWMLQILRGVEACHRSSVVHRDLKPSNLLISADGVLKLADFGQSMMLQETRLTSLDINPENETWIQQQPDYNKISFGKVDSPIGLEACLPDRSAAEVDLVRRLLGYNPAARATAAELLRDSYFAEEPLPVPASDLLQ